MRKILLSVTCLGFSFFSLGQITLTQLPSGGNKKAWVGERIGLTDVTIRYDRPAVKGREGRIWGQLVPVGFVDQGFGTAKAAPWRAGANENTTISFSKDVKVEGQPLKAGTYGFFIAYDSLESTLIFSKNAGSWGSYYYDEKEDALRVKVKPVASTVAKNLHGDELEKTLRKYLGEPAEPREETKPATNKPKSSKQKTTIKKATR